MRACWARALSAEDASLLRRLHAHLWHTYYVQPLLHICVPKPRRAHGFFSGCHNRIRAGPKQTRTQEVGRFGKITTICALSAPSKTTFPGGGTTPCSGAASSIRTWAEEIESGNKAHPYRVLRRHILSRSLSSTLARAPTGHAKYTAHCALIGLISSDMPS